MVPSDHALLSVRDWGGEVEDYLPIHKFLDQTKFHLTNFHHRAFLHNTLGISLCEQFFGDYVENSDGNKIAVRELARRHIIEDCGVVPTVQDTLDALCSNKYGQYNKPRKKDLQWLKENNYEHKN